MNKCFRILSLILCIAMAGSLCACGGEESKSIATDDMSKNVKLVWYVRSSQPKGFEEVMTAANEYLNEKLNVTLDMQCIEPGDYDQKVQLALASGEELDIVWTSNWANKYEPNVSKGAYMALDEYLDLPELESLKNHYSEGIWTAAKISGKIYGVPMEQVMYSQSGYSFMKEISDKYNLTDRIRAMSWVDDNTHGSMDEIEEIYDIVREGEPADYAILTRTAYNTFESYIPSVNGYSVIDGKVDDRPEHNLEIAKRARRWNQKGYFPADIATLDDVSTYENEGKVYSDYERYLPGVEGKFRISKSYEVIVIPTSEAVVNRSGVQSTLSAVTSGCKNPIRALKLLDLMLKDEYMLNLICYGIEGRDYTKDPENPKRMERESGAYYISEYMVGSQFLAYLVPSYEDGVWEETKAANESARVDDFIGFSFDPSPVESEISQCSAVTTEYNKIIGFGLEDPEISFYEREEKFDLAGKQIVMDEIQRQLDDWLASK